MSDQESKPVSKLTSSIPLNKETVRITLKASDLPPSVPSPILSAPTAAPRPPVVAPRPVLSSAPAAPAIVKPATAPAAKPPMMASSGAPPTVKLASSAPSVVTPAPTPTVKLGSVGLPVSAAKLPAITQPMAAASKIQFAQAEEIEEDAPSGEMLSKILVSVALLTVLIFLAIELMVSNIWINAPDNDRAGDWTQLLE